MLFFTRHSLSRKMSTVVPQAVGACNWASLSSVRGGIEEFGASNIVRIRQTPANNRKSGVTMQRLESFVKDPLAIGIVHQQL